MMAQDSEGISIENQVLNANVETEFYPTGTLNLFSANIRERTQNNIQEYEINYSLSKQIQNLRIESNELSSLKERKEMQSDTSKIIESKNNFLAFESDEQQANTKNRLDAEDHEISYSLSELIRKLSIGSETLVPLEMENGALKKHETLSKSHGCDESSNNSLSLKSKGNALERCDYHKSVEKYNETVVLKSEFNLRHKCLLNEKYTDGVASKEQSLNTGSETKNCASFKNEYSRALETKEKCVCSLEKNVNREMGQQVNMPTHKDEIKISLSKLCSENQIEKLVSEVKVQDACRKNSNIVSEEKSKVNAKINVTGINSNMLQKKDYKNVDFVDKIEQVNEDTESGEKSITEHDQSRFLCFDYNLDEKTTLEESSDEKNNEIADSDSKYLSKRFGKNENIYKDSNEYKDNAEEELNENKENPVENFYENEDYVNDSSDEDNENVDEDSDENENVTDESDEDEEIQTEGMGYEIRAHGPVKSQHNVHSNKPYDKKCIPYYSDASTSNFIAQAEQMSSPPYEIHSEEYSTTSSRNSEFTSSPSSSSIHIFDDFEESETEEIVNTELIDIPEEISNFLLSIEEQKYLNIVTNLFEECSAKNNPIATGQNVNQYTSYEESLTLRNLFANEILENVFDTGSSTKGFSEHSERLCQTYARSKLPLSDDSYNKSLREMFGDETILQTVETNVNSRVNLFPKDNFNVLGVQTVRYISNKNISSNADTKNDSKELFTNSDSYGIEELNINSSNRKNCSSSLESFETLVNNAGKKTLSNAANTNSSKGPVLFNTDSKKKKDFNHFSSTNAVSKRENSHIPLKCKISNGLWKQRLRSILHNDRLLLTLGKYYKRIQQSKDVIYVTELEGLDGKRLDRTNLHIAVINLDLEEIYAIVEIQKQYNKTFADINNKDIFKRTALDYAVENKNQIVIKYLEENTGKQSIVMDQKAIGKRRTQKSCISSDIPSI